MALIDDFRREADRCSQENEKLRQALREIADRFPHGRGYCAPDEYPKCTGCLAEAALSSPAPEPAQEHQERARRFMADVMRRPRASGYAERLAAEFAEVARPLREAILAKVNHPAAGSVAGWLQAELRELLAEPAPPSEAPAPPLTGFPQHICRHGNVGYHPGSVYECRKCVEERVSSVVRPAPVSSAPEGEPVSVPCCNCGEPIPEGHAVPITAHPEAPPLCCRCADSIFGTPARPAGESEEPCG